MLVPKSIIIILFTLSFRTCYSDDKTVVPSEPTEPGIPTETTEETPTRLPTPLTSEVLSTLLDFLKDISADINEIKSTLNSCCSNATLKRTQEEPDDEESGSGEMSADDNKAEMASTPIPSSTLPPIPTECDDPFQAIASSCYFIQSFVDEFKSWGLAQDECTGVGGTLASPVRFHDLREYLNIHYREQKFWIGIKYNHNTSAFEWLTGETVDASAWKGDAPSIVAARFCVFLEPSSEYKALNFYCGEKWAYICEKRYHE